MVARRAYNGVAVEVVSAFVADVRVMHNFTSFVCICQKFSLPLDDNIISYSMEKVNTFFKVYLDEPSSKS
jgi:hypothetical protein